MVIFMQVNKIVPQGFCKGVILAINKALEAKDLKNVYSLGSLIHNDIMVKRLSDAGIKTIDVKGMSRIEMLDLIPDGSSVIISAHGASPSVFLKCKEKNLNIIDATCEYVYKTHDDIKKYLSLGYDVYYIGTKGHAECEGAIGISDKIRLISSIDDINNYNFINNSFIINQTTMSIYELMDYHKLIKEKNPNVLISSSICDATTLRQKAVINAPYCDLFIIVGDIKSSNTNKLYKFASQKYKAIMITSLDDLKKYPLDGINIVNITAGASTPREVVAEIIAYLEKK